jgi:hypothetical protein
MIRRMLACLSLLAVAPDRSHGVAWRLLALLIPLVRALARRSGGPGVRMALPGATLADGVVDTRTRWSAMVLCPRCGGAPRVIEMWGSYSDLQSAPVAQSSMLQVSDTPHGRRTRLPLEIRVHITWDSAGMLATRPPQPICSASERRPRLHRLNRAADPLSILEDS